MRWIFVCVVVAGCAAARDQLRFMSTRDLLLLAGVIAVVSLAAAWNLIARRPARAIANQRASNASSRPVRRAFGERDPSCERLRAPDGAIAAVPLASVAFALKDGYSRLSSVHMRGPDGEHVLVDEDEVGAARASGYWPMTASELDSINGS